MTQQEKIELFKEASRKLPKPKPASENQDRIEKTAHRLSLMEYDVGLSCDQKSFLRCTYDNVVDHLQQVISGESHDGKDDGSDKKTIKEEVDLIVYHYSLLVRLREDDPDAWETVEELYGEE